MSFKINLHIQIPNTKYELILYSYSIDSDAIRESEYLVKENGKYYLIEKYFSIYSDNPFGNDAVEDSKKILEKEENWIKSNESIWWR